MSQKTHKFRMEQIRLIRGRTPIKATHKEYFIEFVRKSRASVEYKKYKRVIDLISPENNDKAGRIKNKDSVNFGKS